jgi:hypothetical protein
MYTFYGFSPVTSRAEDPPREHFGSLTFHQRLIPDILPKILYNILKDTNILQKNLYCDEVLIIYSSNLGSRRLPLEHSSNDFGREQHKRTTKKEPGTTDWQSRAECN